MHNDSIPVQKTKYRQIISHTVHFALFQYFVFDLIFFNNNFTEYYQV